MKMICREFPVGLQRNPAFGKLKTGNSKPEVFLFVFSIFEMVKRFTGNKQTAITCSKLTTENLEQGVIYVQS